MMMMPYYNHQDNKKVSMTDHLRTAPPRTTKRSRDHVENSSDAHGGASPSSAVSTISSATISGGCSYRSRIIDIVFQAFLNVWSNNPASVVDVVADQQQRDGDDDDDHTIWKITLREIVESSVSIWKDKNQASNNNDSNNNVAKHESSNKCTNNGKEFYDIEIRTATSLFHRYKQTVVTGATTACIHEVDVSKIDEVSNFVVENDTISTKRKNKHKSKKKSVKDKQKTASASYSVLTIISPYGVERRMYSPRNLSELILPYIEDKLLEYKISQHARIDPSSGFICICTYEFIQQQQKTQNCNDTTNSSSSSTSTTDGCHNTTIRHCAGGSSNTASIKQQQQQSEACPYCPKWFRGRKGLWWHVQSYHAKNYATAKSTNHTTWNTSLALVVYCNDNDDNNNNNNNKKKSDVISGSLSVPPSPSKQSNHTKDDLSDGTAPNDVSSQSLKNNNYLSNSTDTSLDDPFFDIVKRGNLIALQIFLSDNDSIAKNAPSSITGSWYDKRNTNAISTSTDDKIRLLQSMIDRNGASLLLWAAGCGHLDVVEYLIQHCYVDPNFAQRGKRSFRGRTALHWAARNGHLHIVQYLLSLYLPSSNHDDEHYSRQKDCTIPSQISNPNHSTDNINPSNLASIHSEGSSRTRIVNVDAATADGTTAFGWAAWQGRLGILKVLHDAGCNVQAMNSFGCTAVLWAAQGTKTTTNKQSPNVENTIGDDSIQLNYQGVIAESDGKIVSENTSLVAKGLFHSVSLSSIHEVKVMEWLESVGCSLDILNHTGHGILHKSAQRGQSTLCEWYLSKRIAAKIQSRLEEITASNRNYDEKDLYEFLLQLLQLIGPDNDGCTPSDLAGMEQFLDLGAFLANQEEKLVTRIHQAFYYNESNNQVDANINKKSCTHPNDEAMSATSQVWELPGWLRSPTLPASNQQKHMLFEPWAGVNRMRSIWTMLTKKTRQERKRT